MRPHLAQAGRLHQGSRQTLRRHLLPEELAYVTVHLGCKALLRLYLLDASLLRSGTNTSCRAQPQRLTGAGALQTLQRQLPPDQLAYVAALAIGTPLIFGDVPMEQTLRALLYQPSVAQLDDAFGHQASPSRAVAVFRCSA